MRSKAPYGEMDQNIVSLAKALNSFQGIQTIGSCGGHSNPAPYQQGKGSWVVLFAVSHNEHGWLALEFLVWMIEGTYYRQPNIRLSANSAAPYMNKPGDCLYFTIAGSDGASPDKLAQRIMQERRLHYMGPRMAAKILSNAEMMRLAEKELANKRKK